ncbi:interferon-induced protein 44-like isoform X3 [Cynoglossus semilaevis]|uniref:Interferon-induced protein 44-like n=1 Tax=Cynoglossus semilaevis TaxID=244447 RepID=A0A3P8W899_CYNSE|nr:interferon-induced protein 44-like isoform X3 [Cynoglossus semilaevis]
MGGALFSHPWRDLPEAQEASLALLSFHSVKRTSSAVSRKTQTSLDFVKTYKPRNSEVRCLRILLHGPVGAGKSSFINSVDSVLQGRITGRALTDAVAGTSFTQRYMTYRIKKDEATHYSFLLNDIMAYEQHPGHGISVEDVKLVLSGHVLEGYKFVPDRPLTVGENGYNTDPTLEDITHVLVFVVPAGSISVLSENIVKKMREVRLAASEMGIPQLAILTKVDEACSHVQKNINNIYKSKFLKEQVDNFHVLLGIPLNCIFLVKNYSTELELNKVTNATVLAALRQMLSFGEDFLNNLES